MKHAQEISQKIGQWEAVITYDLAIYVKAKETQLTFTAGFSNTLLRLGSFHIALNFLSIIGYKEGGRVVCVTHEVCEVLQDLASDQEEVDTRLILHPKYATRPETISRY